MIFSGKTFHTSFVVSLGTEDSVVEGNQTVPSMWFALLENWRRGSDALKKGITT
jgi:hypothetical protein